MSTSAPHDPVHCDEALPGVQALAEWADTHWLRRGGRRAETATRRR